MIIYKDLEKKKTSDLEKLLTEKRHELYELQFKVQADELKNIRALRVLRREIAKILTVLNVHAK